MCFFISEELGMRYRRKMSNHLNMQHKLTGIYNQEGEFLVSGTN
jgi:hypothetical protein